MYKYIKAYTLGYNEGIKDALIDKEKNKVKKFKKIDEKIIMSKLYDVAYIKGYNKFINIEIKNN